MKSVYIFADKSISNKQCITTLLIRYKPSRISIGLCYIYTFGCFSEYVFHTLPKYDS